MKKLIFGAMLLSAFAFQAKAQSATADAKAEVSSQLSISVKAGTALDFGKIAVSAAQTGSCTITTLGVVQVSGGVNVIPSTTQNAIFDLTGIAGSTYAITLPVSAVVTLAGGSGETMTIDELKALPTSKGSESLTGLLKTTDGSDSFTVGGKLNVNANQTNGVYNGTFNVTAAYN